MAFLLLHNYTDFILKSLFVDYITYFELILKSLIVLAIVVNVSMKFLAKRRNK